MSHAQTVINHLENFLKIYGKTNTFENGYSVYKLLKAHIDSSISSVDRLNETFKEINMKNPWTQCPECESPVIVEMGRCPFCGEALEVEAKVEAQKPKNEKKSKKEEEVEEEKPVKTKKKAKKEEPKKKKEIVEEEELEDEILEDDQDDNEEEVALPSEEEVNKMKKKELLDLIESESLDVKPQGLRIAELREAVNEALDASFDDEEEGEEDEDLELTDEEEELLEEDEKPADDDEIDFGDIDEEEEEYFDDEDMDDDE